MATLHRAWLPLTVAAVLSTAPQSCRAAEESCEFPAPAKELHPWPRAHGLPGNTRATNLTGPRNLSSPAWSWHPLRHRFQTVLVGGPLVDDDGHLYVTSIEAIYKLTDGGKLVWSYQAPGMMCDAPSLVGAVLYGADTLGHVYAVDTLSGGTIWLHRYGTSKGGDTGSVEAYDGVLVLATEEAEQGGGGRRVVGINATDGALLWEFAPVSAVWNFAPLFPGDRSLVFQDSDARVYRLALQDGELLWEAGGGSGESWAGGGAALGSGTVFAASSKAQMQMQRPWSGGGVQAYRLSDGELAWERELEHPFLAWPAVGVLAGRSAASVVVTAGAKAQVPWKLVLLGSLSVCWSGAVALSFAWVLFAGAWRGWRVLGRRCCRMLGLASALAPAMAFVYAAQTPVHEAEVLALDAETGELQWRYAAEPWPHVSAAGDSEGFFRRLLRPPHRFACFPPAFSSARIDGNGTVYVGYHNGKVLGLRDEDGSGTVEESEVFSFDAGAAFPHSGPAFAPGLFAIASCDSIYVWRAESGR